MRKKAILIVGLALLIAAAGVVYAHWRDSLLVDVEVTTGTFDIDWTSAFTDDDGENDYGEEVQPADVECIYPTDCELGDPAGYPSFGEDDLGNLIPLEITPADRYDKAVGDCFGTYTEDTFTLVAGNVYPSYHCTMWSDFTNTGSVPAKVQELYITLSSSSVNGTDYYLDLMLIQDAWSNVLGTPCGQQIDPDEVQYVINQFHVPQEILIPGTADYYTLPQEATFSVTQEIVFVNWNEWSADACYSCWNGVCDYGVWD